VARRRRSHAAGTRLALRATIASVAALGATAPTAGADIFAVSDSRPPSTCAKCQPPPVESLGIVLVDVNTGLRGTLPAAVNTSADEFRPSITSDGNRMVFMRSSAGGAVRIIMADLGTGQTSDLFNGFEVASHPPRSPEITPDGTVVLTGGQFRPEAGKFRPFVTATDVTSFPTGPYTHTDKNVDRLLTVDGFVDDVAATGSSVGSQVAFGAPLSTGPEALGFTQLFSSGLSGVIRSGTGPFGHPALGSPGGSPTVVFDERNNSGDSGTDIVFVPADTSVFGNAARTRLPINTSQDDARPAFTPDGRYVAFVRTGSDGHDRLFAWDSQTQTLVNSTGVDLGQVDADVGSPSLYTKAVFTLSSVAPSGLVSFSLLTSTGVGILVQRVVGHHKLFGRKVPTLKKVGKVPLGHFKKGHGKIKWNLRVNGKRLRPGTYQVTPRAVTPSGKFRDFGKPAIIHVRR
jgi:hypothetical protein